jgi:hypothetical protein
MLHQVERACERAEERAAVARSALLKATTRDPRLLLMLASNDPDRLAYEAANEAMHAAQARADQAREAVEQARKANAPKADPKAMRDALRAAIIAERRASNAITRNEQAIARAVEIVGDAVQRLEKAEDALEKARQADANAIAKAAAGSGKVSASLVPKARATQQSATDALEAARVARTNLQAKQGKLEEASRTAKTNVEKAILAVIAAEVPIKQIVTKAEALMTEIVRLRIVLREMLSARLIADEKLKEGAKAVLWALNLPGEVGAGSGDWSRHEATIRWQQTRARLMVDADAPLFEM